MTFPQDWTRRAAVTIPAAQVAGTGGALADFPLRLTAANLPDEMFDADGPAPAQDGGGDIRFTSDSDGTNRLAVEIVAFVTDPDPTAGQAEIWVKVPALDKDADTTIHVWYATTGSAVQPAADDPFGRNAVWSDYLVRYHGGDVTDVTGGGADLALVNGAVANVDNFAFDGIDDYADAALAAAVAQDITLELVTDINSQAGNSRIFGLTTFDSSNVRALISELGGDDWRYNPNDGVTNITVDEPDLAEATKTWLWAVEQGTSRELQKGNNSPVTDATSLNHTTAGWDHVNLGARIHADGATQFADCRVYECGIYAGALSQDWRTTAYRNQSAPATFAVAGAVEDVGGATALVIAPAAGGHSLTSNAASLAEDQSLAATEAAHGHVAVSTALAQQHRLQTGAAAHAVASPAATLGQDHRLGTLTTFHGLGAESAALLIGGGAAHPGRVRVAEPVSPVTVRADARLLTVADTDPVHPN